jgi:hypothetical protein
METVWPSLYIVSDDVIQELGANEQGRPLCKEPMVFEEETTMDPDAFHENQQHAQFAT